MDKPNWIIGIIILLLPSLFVMKYTAVPYHFYSEDVSVLKLAFQHTGQRVIEYDEIAALKERAKKYREQLKKEKEVRMSLKSRQTTTRERFPVAIELFIDGEKIHEREYQPTGSQRDAVSVIYDAFELEPGTHKIKVVMKDSKKEGTAPFIFEDTVEFKPRDVKVVTYDKVGKRLHWSENLIPLLEHPEHKKEE